MAGKQTFHGRDGRFTSSRSAHTVTKGGERYEVVRELRKLGGEPETSDEPESETEGRVRRQVATLLATSPGWVALDRVVESAFADEEW